MSLSGSLAEAPQRALGVCTVTIMVTDPLTLGRTLRIDHADEHIEISDELVAEGIEGGWAGEGLFRIDATNGSVTYALGEQGEIRGVWSATRRTPWPPTAEAGGDHA